MDTLTEDIRMRAEAHAFRALLAHLQAHPEIQNMETMTVGGFCRNCLSKWLLAGLRAQAPLPVATPVTYDVVSTHVYGMDPKAWKASHQAKATPEALARYEASSARHAKHGTEAQAEVTAAAPRAPASAGASEYVLSLSPCCPDSTEAVSCAPPLATGAARKPPPPPAMLLTVGVLTVSDRASAGVYADASGPMVLTCLAAFSEAHPHVNTVVTRAQVIPDDQEEIACVLREWSRPGAAGPACKLIITTGGTGFSSRDVTPEATSSVVSKQMPSLPLAIAAATARDEPLSFLSRGVAGVAGTTVILNVPGAPRAVAQHLAVGLPLVAHAVAAASADA